MGAVRGFARYLSALDPATRFPGGSDPHPHHRVSPTSTPPTTRPAAGGRSSSAPRIGPHLPDPDRAVAVTGMREGEAIGWIATISTPSRGCSPSAMASSASPASSRCIRAPSRRYPATPPASAPPPPRHEPRHAARVELVDLDNRNPADRDNVSAVFAWLVPTPVWSGRRRRPRLHDLRHRFAVNTLIAGIGRVGRRAPAAAAVDLAGPCRPGVDLLVPDRGPRTARTRRPTARHHRAIIGGRP